MVRAAVRQNLLWRPGDLRLHFGIVEALSGAGRRRGQDAGTAVCPGSRGEPARRRDEHQLRRETVALYCRSSALGGGGLPFMQGPSCAVTQASAEACV